MPSFKHDGLEFYYHDSQQGNPVFVIQHGLGGNADDLQTYFMHPKLRIVGMDARGHGQTTPLGAVEKLNFRTMADDMIAFLDYLAIEQAIISGISMGAGISLNVALRYPERIQALILARPAWLNSPMPLEPLYHEIAGIIRRYDAADGLAIFQKTAGYLQLQENAPAVANSLCNLFGQGRAKETVEKLERIASDQPFADIEALHQIQIPTLIMATHQDPAHPYIYGEFYAQHIPHAQFVELTSKSKEPLQHQKDTQQAIEDFLEHVVS